MWSIGLMVGSSLVDANHPRFEISMASMSDSSRMIMVDVKAGRVKLLSLSIQ